MQMTMRKLLAGSIALATIGLLAAGAARAESVIRIGMTASDIPTTSGAPNQGGEGLRFAGYTMYDGLVNWDLSKSDVPAEIVPGLATEWKVDKDDQTKWVFTLRKGVKFHDGSDFDADAVIFAFERILNKESPSFDPKGAAQIRARIPSVKGYKKIDDYTIEITTPTPDSQLLYQLSWLLIPSPAQFEKVGGDWNKFATTPAGTGPFKLEDLVPRERAVLVPFEEYWNPDRKAKSKIILMPIPEAASRTAALLSGQVDWIEAPAPDAVPRMKQAGMQIVTNTYPHIWPYTLSYLDGSPFLDENVRKAANLAIDRDGLVKLLGGLAEPSHGMVEPGHPWYGKPTFEFKYDPEAAKKLLAKSGYGPDKPIAAKLVISTSGSGQMQPLPMNEFIQQNMKEVGIDLQLEVVEWSALRTISRAGATAPDQKGFHAINNSYGTADPFNTFIRFFHSESVAPKGRNWGHYGDPWVDEQLDKVITTFDVEAQNAILAKVHEKLVNEAAWVWIVKDLNPRALGPKVRGFTPPQSWYVDLTPVYKEG
jgi:ABC-type transport system substrate-binding protein